MVDSKSVRLLRFILLRDWDKDMLKKGLIALSVVSLVACGGGGGGGSTANNNDTPATALGISTSNRDAVAQQTVPAMFGSGLAASSSVVVGVGADSGGIDAWKTIVTDLANSAPSLFAQSGMNTAVGVAGSTTSACSSGGFRTATLVNSDSNTALSSGDAMTLSLSNCNDGKAVGNGTVTITFNTVIGTTVGAANSKFVMTYEFTNYTRQTSTMTTAISGSITYTNDATSAVTVPTQRIESPTFGVRVTYNNATASVGLRDYSYVLEDHTTYWSEALNGTVVGSGFGDSVPHFVSFATVTPFLTTKGVTYSYAGQAIITGANNSKLRFTALSATQVRLEVDADGDGIYEGGPYTSNWTSIY